MVGHIVVFRALVIAESTNFLNLSKQTWLNTRKCCWGVFSPYSTFTSQFFRRGHSNNDVQLCVKARNLSDTFITLCLRDLPAFWGKKWFLVQILNLAKLAVVACHWIRKQSIAETLVRLASNIRIALCCWRGSGINVVLIVILLFCIAVVLTNQVTHKIDINKNNKN